MRRDGWTGWAEARSGVGGGVGRLVNAVTLLTTSPDGCGVRAIRTSCGRKVSLYGFDGELGHIQAHARTSSLVPTRWPWPETREIEAEAASNSKVEVRAFMTERLSRSRWCQV